jgi:hypothetical protein
MNKYDALFGIERPVMPGERGFDMQAAAGRAIDQAVVDGLAGTGKMVKIKRLGGFAFWDVPQPVETRDAYVAALMADPRHEGRVDQELALRPITDAYGILVPSPRAMVEGTACCTDAEQKEAVAHLGKMVGTVTSALPSREAVALNTFRYEADKVLGSPISYPVFGGMVAYLIDRGRLVEQDGRQIVSPYRQQGSGQAGRDADRDFRRMVKNGLDDNERTTNSVTGKRRANDDPRRRHR